MTVDVNKWAKGALYAHRVRTGGDYARVSTGDQDVAGQTMRLKEAGAIKVFTDIKSGKTMDRPRLVELLAYARASDTLAIVRLDRLGRSLAELLETVKMLRERQIDLLSLEEKDRHVLGRWRADISCFRHHCSFRASADLGANERRYRGCAGKRETTQQAAPRHKEGRGGN